MWLSGSKELDGRTGNKVIPDVVSLVKAGFIPFRVMRYCLSAGRKSLAFPGAAFCLESRFEASIRSLLAVQHAADLPLPYWELVGQKVSRSDKLLYSRTGMQSRYLVVALSGDELTWCYPSMLLELGFLQDLRKEQEYR